MRRAHMIRIRASDEELAQLAANARSVGLTLSSYLRWLGLQQPQASTRRPTPVRQTTRKNQRRSR
jgi:hypothetical protein